MDEQIDIEEQIEIEEAETRAAQLVAIAVLVDDFCQAVQHSIQGSDADFDESAQ